MSDPSLVCVIDDDESLGAALVNLLRSFGYRAAAYGSAEAFLSGPDLPGADCIITDVQMPGLSGIDLVQALPGRGCAAPVIMITARTERALLDRALASRPHRLLRKPFDAEELASCLEQAIGPGMAVPHGRGAP